MKIKLVGVDPSMSNLGIAKMLYDIQTGELTVERLQLVKTSPEKDKAVKKAVRKNSEDLERAKLLFEGLQTAIADADFVIAEVPVGSQSARAMCSYGMCLGVLASITGVPLIQVTPTEVKKAGFGVASATKEEMIEWATGVYPGANWLTKKRLGEVSYIGDNEHLADAVASVHAGIKTEEFKRAIAMLKILR